MADHQTEVTNTNPSPKTPKQPWNTEGREMNDGQEASVTPDNENLDLDHDGNVTCEEGHDPRKREALPPMEKKPYPSEEEKPFPPTEEKPIPPHKKEYPSKEKSIS
ncbi:hypothetical protein PIB30_033269 [Stylosanthes scabra]|uniref:Uncharacterized protein n=1 Tax=Stylosanthes scabra TaxID=79078 RepID=A0ABU6Z9B7_9FABA|nr:hypothetical protein [Stylosanthes scabra]